MSGRGCTITVKVLGSTTDSTKGPEDLSLPVALHSPLEVLKDQLAELTGKKNINLKFEKHHYHILIAYIHCKQVS